VKTSARVSEKLGDVMQEFVNRISHRQGATLAVLTEESVTLHQIPLLRRLQRSGVSTPSALATLMHMSAPAMSQMIDRLFALGLLARAEAPADRRRKNLSLTPKGRALLERIRKTRASEYALGVSPLSSQLQAQLLRVLRKALPELPDT